MVDETIIRESRKRVRLDEEEKLEDDMELIQIVIGFVMLVVCSSYFRRNSVRELTWNAQERAQKRAIWMDTLKNNTKCLEQLRFDRRCFGKLCSVLRLKGGLVTSRNVTDEEVVAFFLHILAHNLKNRTIQALFARSGETVSRQFHTVLRAVLKIGNHYIKEVNHNTSFADEPKWKYFKGVVGALDGTHIKMTVPLEDRCRYRDRKGDISTNVLATCDPHLCFSYVLPGWEGSASDPRVLRDALQRQPYHLKVPKNKYFLVDLGYTNGDGFLAPYKGTRYHLNLWRGNTPTNYKELFNLQHSSARNTIERAFGCLKERWAILRTSSFFSKTTQVRIINACVILHNFLRYEKMDESNLMAEVEQDLLNAPVEVDGDEDFIASAQQTQQWNEFRDKLAKNMWNDYRVMSSDKQKHVVVISQPKKRGYVSWNSQMDAILISVFYDQVSQGNKGDGDWKPQAYQAVVDELKNKLSMSLTTDHVRNRVKIWKKHYGIITEIRTKTKFTWDNEKKMVVIGIEDMADWMKYTQSFPSAAPYSNKCVENWDDICVLVGPDRAIGDGGEHYEDGVNMMDEEAGEARSSSLDTTSCSSRKKQKSDRLADAVSSFANSFQGYVETRKKESSILSGKEVRDVVTKVYGILPHQVLRAVLLLMESPQKFQMLKDLPEDEKLDWILLCLNASNN